MALTLRKFRLLRFVALPSFCCLPFTVREIIASVPPAERVYPFPEFVGNSPPNLVLLFGITLTYWLVAIPLLAEARRGGGCAIKQMLRSHRSGADGVVRSAQMVSPV